GPVHAATLWLQSGAVARIGARHKCTNLLLVITAYIAVRPGAGAANAELHLRHRRWRDDRGCRGGGYSGRRSRRHARPDQRRAASAVQPPTALEGPVAGRAGGQYLAHGGAG